MKVFRTHPQWPAVQMVADTLYRNNYQAWLAGGCVRDALLGVVPHDFDIATNAKPDDVERLFPNSIAVGKSFGVMIVPFKGFQIEIASFRKDGDYKDGRRPERIEFSSPKEDAKRRDFTINALFYDILNDQIIDYVRGRSDLDERLIRAVGDPYKRFDEDKLRILRAVRFVSQLDFEIEEKTFEAILKTQHQTIQVSFERVRDELLKLLKGKARKKALKLYKSTGLMTTLTPELDGGFDIEFTSLQLSQLNDLSHDELYWTLFLWNFKSDVKEFLKKLKLSNRETDWVHRALHVVQKVKDKSITKLDIIKTYLDLGEGFYQLLLLYEPENEVKPHLQTLDQLEFSEYPERLLQAKDLSAYGISPSPKMGEILNEAYDLQLLSVIKNRKDAQEWLAQYIRGQK